MTVDISKIKPGDMVTLVPLEVATPSITEHGNIAVYAGTFGKAFFPPDQIATHHPAPMVIEIGDKVVSRYFDRPHVVLGVAGEKVWTLRESDGIYFTLDEVDLDILEKGTK